MSQTQLADGQPHKQTSQPSPSHSGDPARTRTHSWDDPSPTLAALAERSGMDLLGAMAAGELPAPPVMSTLGMELAGFTRGTARFQLEPQEMHYNPLGTVHGGVIATLLDSAAGCAVHTMLPAGNGYTSVDLTTKFLRPVTAATGTISVTGTVLSFGKRTALAEARLTDARGRLLAYATSTCLIVTSA